jgi:phage terminase large subunit
LTPEQTIIRWRKGGPAQFAVDVFGAAPTDQQWEASRAIVERRRVSIRSGHGTGKSAFMAWCVLWFMSCYYPCKVPATAPTSHQLEDILWAEIAKWHAAMRERVPQLANEFEWTKERFYLKSNPNESFAVARTARPERPEALQGFHSENILFLIDEASGVAENVFQVAEGALSTEGAFVIMAANPTREEGYFYDSHHKMRERWAALHWDGEQSPMVSRQYVDDMRAKYGVDSPIYQVRVKGNFATATDGVIPLSLCEAARVREVQPIASAPVIWGLDVARFGDDSTALAKRKGNVQLEPCREWYGKDTMQTAGLIKLEYDSAKERPSVINVDVIGIGSGVVDRLKELGLPARGINVAESPSVEDKYMRLRDELWFACREWLEARDCRLADDDELIGELVTPKYRIESNGKIKVESKDEMKRRGVASPNRADAWNLTFAPGISVKGHRKPIKYSNVGIV